MKLAILSLTLMTVLFAAAQYNPTVQGGYQFDWKDNWTQSDAQTKGIWTDKEFSYSTMAVGEDGNLYFAYSEEADCDRLYRRSSADGALLMPATIDWGGVEYHAFSASFVANDTQGTMYLSSCASAGVFPLTIIPLNNTLQAVESYSLPLESGWRVFSPVAVFGDVYTGNFSAMCPIWRLKSGKYIKDLVAYWQVSNGVASQPAVVQLETLTPYIQMISATEALICDTEGVDTQTITRPTLVEWITGNLETVAQFDGKYTDTLGCAARLIDHDGVLLMLSADSGINPRFHVEHLYNDRTLKFSGTVWTYPQQPLGHVKSATDFSTLSPQDRMSFAVVHQPGMSRSASQTGQYTIYTYVHQSGLHSATLTYKPGVNTQAPLEPQSREYTLSGNTIRALAPVQIYNMQGIHIRSLQKGETTDLKNNRIYILKTERNAKILRF